MLRRFPKTHYEEIHLSWRGTNNARLHLLFSI
jgi:hypothetical protein